MTRPLPKACLLSPQETWLNMIVAYRMRGGCCEMTLRIKGKRVRFQLAPDGVWRRRIRRKGANYWRKANGWDALQCRLSYNSYCSVFKKAPRVEISREREDAGPDVRGH